MANPLSVTRLAKLAEELLAEHRDEKGRLDKIADALANDMASIYVPTGARREYKMLVEQARFNILPLIVTSKAQNLFVDGYRPTGENGRAPDSKNSPIWDAVWQPNRMDARQRPLHEAALTYGYSYATVVPGNPAPVVTPYSPRKLTAIYDDEVNDEWPQYAIVVHRPGKEGTIPDLGTRLTIYDTEYRYDVRRYVDGWRLSADVERHGLGVVPVVRYVDGHNCDELPKGRIEPLLPAQAQLNQTTFGLLMAQQFTAFKQRWAAGLAVEKDEHGNVIAPFQHGPDKLWWTDKEGGKFGEFSETNLAGYLDSRDKALLFVSAVGQIPPHNLLVGSGISNISAEALAALESAHRHDINDLQTSFGESHEQTMRLAGKALGGDEGQQAWRDMSAQVVWRDTTPRSLAQIADALGKLAQQLGIPPRALWERIPGVTDKDIERWEDMADEDDLMRELRGLVNGQQTNEEPAVGNNGSEPVVAGA